MFPGIGTVGNSLAVLVIGILTRSFIKKEFENFEKNLYPIGLVTMALAVRESLQSDSLIIPLVSVLIGSAIGSYIKIEERFESLGNYLHKKYESDVSDKSIFISSFFVYAFSISFDFFMLFLLDFLFLL